MKTIWKYSVPMHDELGRVTDQPTISMPAGAEVLTVQMQGDVPTVWALVDPDAAVERRRFVIVGTGHAADGVGRYVGSWQQGYYVFHLFDADSARNTMNGAR